MNGSEFAVGIMASENFISEVSRYFTAATRFILPFLAVLVLFRCAKSLFSGHSEKEVWGYLTLPNGSKVELNNWENIIGRSASCDVALSYQTLSRTHGAMTRDADGKWQVFDIGSKTGVYVNGKKIDGPTSIKSGDLINMGGVDMVFVKATRDEERARAKERVRPGKEIRPWATLLILTEFILFLGLQLCFAAGESLSMAMPVSFAAFLALMWLSYFITRIIDRVGFEIETIAFFLTAIGFAVCAGSDPSALYKQVVCLFTGIIAFFVIGIFLRDLNRVKKLRWFIAAAGLLLLAVNVVTAESIFGAKNWLSIGSISFQPSEFVKICFVFAGAATLDRLFTKRNLILFVAFAAACVGCLVMMSDFGTAAVFFTAYLVIAFMRSGSFATVILSASGAGFAAFIAVTAKPYIAERFSTWGNAWAAPNAGGYQQVRTMASAASGGLFGLGAGKGWLHNIFAADTDMVFGIMLEELGLIVGVTAVLALIAVAVFAVKTAGSARSSFYAIASCAAVSMLLFQVILNVFGSLDILPFTGVTFPFVSKGGSSLISCWSLLGFLKAADTRQNASFAIKLPAKRKPRKKRRGEETEAQAE